MECLGTLEDLNLSSKDGKSIVPAVIGIFRNLQTYLDTMKTEFLDLLTAQNTEISGLKSSVDSLQKRVLQLEDRIEDNESYERRDTLIVSGNKVPVKQSTENTTEVICNVLKNNLNIVVNPQEISVSHRLNTKKTERAPIIVKFCRRNVKSDVLTSARRNKAENLFVNECLTPTQQTISYVLRRAKRDFPELISGSTTFDGKNFVWVKPPNPNAPGAKDLRLPISTRTKLEEFCSRTLKKPLSDYVENWVH